MWDPRAGNECVVTEDIPAERGHPLPRCGCGSGGPGPYRVDAHSLVLADVSVSAGMDFTPDISPMCHPNLAVLTIARCRYDPATGNLVFDAVVRDPEGEGVPDGVALDEHGGIWSARRGGDARFRFSPDGKLLGSKAFPARKVSSLSFRGVGWSAV